jgi:hypothetical protein
VVPERVRRHRGTRPYEPCFQSHRQSHRTRKFSRHCPELVTAFPLSPEPIKPPSTHQRSTPPPPPFPAPLSSSPSRNHLNSRRLLRCDSEESGHCWRRRRCQEEESSCRCRFASAPMTPASSPSSPVVELLLSATPVRLGPVQRLTMPMRRWILIQRQHTGSAIKIDLTGRTPLSGFKPKTSPARGITVGLARSGSECCGLAQLDFDP